MFLLSSEIAARDSRSRAKTRRGKTRAFKSYEILLLTAAYVKAAHAVSLLSKKSVPRIELRRPSIDERNISRGNFYAHDFSERRPHGKNGFDKVKVKLI